MLIGFLLLLFSIEFALYQHYFLKFVAPFCPVNDDQLVTYLYAYRSHLSALERGPLCILTDPQLLFLAVPMKGVLFPWLTYAFSWLGCSRWPVGAVNLVLFFIGQSAILFYLCRQRGLFAGLIALGFFISAGTNYHIAGGINDLRLDYAGMIVMGLCFISVVTAICTPTLPRMSTAAAMFFIATNTRSILLFYWCAALFTCMLLCQVLAFSKFSKIRIEAKSWRNRTVLLGLLAGANLLIFFGLHWETFKGYYIGCKTSGEDIERARWDGVRDTVGLLMFYGKSFFQHFCAPLVASALILVPTSILQRIRKSRVSNNTWTPSDSVVTIVAASLVVCVFVLTAGYAPTPVVMGVLLLPICIALATISHAAIASLGSRRVELVAAILVFCMGLAVFAKEMRYPTNLPHQQVTEAKQASKILTDLTNTLAKEKKPVGVTWLLCHSDINYITLEIFWYETGRKKQFADLAKHRILPALPARSFPEVLELVKDADYVLVPTQFPKDATSCFNYASMIALKKQGPELLQRIEADFPFKVEYDMGLWKLGLFSKVAPVRQTHPNGCDDSNGL